jgi:hypothetical protein
MLQALSNNIYSAIAPYVFHSIDFGSEPIGDMVDGDNSINDLKSFKTATRPYGIPVGLSGD